MKSVIGISILLLPSLFALSGCVPLETPYGSNTSSSGRGFSSQSGYNSPGGYPPQQGENFGTNQGIGGRPPGAAPYQPHSDSSGQPPTGGGLLADPGNPNLPPAGPGAATGPAASGGAAGSGQTGDASGTGAGSAQTPSTTAASDHPRGIPVPNMPGHVYSPHSRDQGIVDVSEWPSGTLVKDPFKPTEDLWFYVP